MSDQAKKTTFLDKANFVVTVLAFLGIPAMTLVVSLELSNLKQGFQIMMDTEDTKNTSTFVDKATYQSRQNDIDSKFTQQETHLDFVDHRENEHHAQTQLQLQHLQDTERHPTIDELIKTNLSIARTGQPTNTSYAGE